MNAFIAPAVVTFFTIALLLSCSAYVSFARGRYGIHAPATTGHPQFDVAYRIQMNTLENAVAFLAALWLCALYLSAGFAGAIGAIWLAARAWYALAYARNPKRRGSAYTLSVVALVTLAVAAAIGILRSAL